MPRLFPLLLCLMAIFSVHVTVPALDDAIKEVRALTGPDRTAAHQVMAAGLEQLTQGHLRGIGRGAKGTSSKLGAAPTDFYNKAAGTVEGKADASGVKLSMQRAGLSRAFRPYDLRPLAGKLLTIPVDAESYGKRAPEFSGLKWRRFSEADVAAGKSDRAGLLLGRPATEPGGFFHALFAGATKVHQDQDRAILPSDEAWLEEMKEGALTYLETSQGGPTV